MIWADDYVTRAGMSDGWYCLQMLRDVKISRKFGIQAECLEVSTGQQNLFIKPTDLWRFFKVSTGKSNSKYDQLSLTLYRNAPHNDVSFNDGPHIRRWSHNIII